MRRTLWPITFAALGGIELGWSKPLSGLSFLRCRLLGSGTRVPPSRHVLQEVGGSQLRIVTGVRTHSCIRGHGLTEMFK